MQHGLVTFTFDLLTPKAHHFEYIPGYSLHQVWTLWDHSFLSYAADKQTDKQTDSKILLTPTDIVEVDNDCLLVERLPALG